MESSGQENGPVYRFIATREVLRQQEIDGMESQQTLPFPGMEGGLEAVLYKVHGMVTNLLDMPGELLIRRGSAGTRPYGKGRRVHSPLVPWSLRAQ